MAVTISAGPACRLPVAADEVSDRHASRSLQGRELDLGVERQQARNPVAGGRGGADVADQRAAVLHLRAADISAPPPEIRQTPPEARPAAGSVRW